jgi:glycosyltransferase involved in cell wall biosynthesis
MNTKKHRIAIIGTVGLPARYGGFETLADHLVRNMSDKYEPIVYCTKKRYPKADRIKTYLGARLKYIPFDANGAQSIIYDTLSILHAAFFADVLLVLGVSGAWILPFVRIFTRKKIIVSIDGIEWRREKWSLPAKWYLWWAESIAVRFSHIDISDNESIQNYTALRYGSLSRVIEYGADHVNQLKITPELKKNYSFTKLPYALKVCRVEPENNVHNVLQAFAELPKHQLVIIGNWKNSEYGKKLLEKYAAFKNIFMLDPIYNQTILDALRTNAFLYIHGHSAGGTNPALVEAMYLGLPIATFGVSYNKTTTEGKALYFYDSESLKSLVQNVDIETFKRIGVAMKMVAERRYRWSVITRKYEELFQDALAMKPKLSINPALSNVNYHFLNDKQASHIFNQLHFYEKR